MSAVPGRQDLSLQFAPPLSVPMRFFLTAPLFAFAAAAALGLHGGGLLGHRALPATIATAHLLTLGFMAMTMLGALFQMIPVLCGAPFPRPRLAAALVHMPLALGTPLLAAGLAGTAPVLPVAMGLLAFAFAVFLVFAAGALARAPGRGPGVVTLRLALAALVVTVLLGLAAASLRAGLGPAWLPAATATAHAGWGLAGWLGLLVAGVAYQVVPMFQITPPYPQALQRLLGPLVTALLVAWTVTLLQPAAAPLATALAVAIALAAAGFAVATLRLQSQRRRRIPDVTTDFWRVAMLSLVAAVALRIAPLVVPVAAGQSGPLGVAFGVLVLGGFGQSVIVGMLYKIVPFLAWLHLTRAGIRGTLMQDFVPDAQARGHLRLHVAALLATLATVAWPALAPLAALLGAGAALWLEANLLRALWRYRRERARPAVTVPAARGG